MPTVVEASGFEPPYELEPASTMRKTIARRLTESKQTVPHFYLSVECEIDALLEMRKSLNDKANDAYKISVNDMVLKAVALGLRKVPAANASWTGDAIKFYQRSDISVAVAIEGGLITPVVRGADNKGLETISNEMKDLAGRAREGKLMPEDYEGGTFSISNLGMFGISEFAAVINPPQGCIPAIGAGTERPVVKDGALAVATVMTCTLSVDHRAVDGAVGAEFLAAFKGLIEDPLTMLL